MTKFCKNRHFKLLRHQTLQQGSFNQYVPFQMYNEIFHKTIIKTCHELKVQEAKTAIWDNFGSKYMFENRRTLYRHVLSISVLQSCCFKNFPLDRVT